MAREAWPIPELWPGATCVILAGGPSLTLAQVRHVAMARLANRCRVIAVNDAVFVAWWSDWLHACDNKWWIWHRETVLKFPGIRTTCTETVFPSWAHYLRVTPPDDNGMRTGFAEPADEVAGGGNGGYQAIQIAVKAGAQKVLLLGFDMRFVEGRGHWFGEHQDEMRSQYEDTMLPNFPGLAAALDARGVEVVNCSPNSALDVWPMARIEDVL